MIERDDLRASVSAGILTEAQAVALISLADARKGARQSLEPGDEPFELFRGFNEIFIVVGMVILAFGWAGVVSLMLFDNLSGLRTTTVLTGLVAATVLWLLSEYFIRTRRMVAPAIALSVMFAANAFYGFSGGLSEVFMIARGDNSTVPLPLGLATLVLAIFWLRFRVPFALALIALGTFLTLIMVAANAHGSPGTFRDLFLLSADGPFAIITLILGLVVFAIAMAFDMSDPHRVTRRAANGFWLHVVAAPALVNTVALSLLSTGTALSNALLAAVLCIVALIAIVIDRRSFLIAAIGYTVVLTSILFKGEGAVFTVLALGALLLVLGARWERIRARLMAALPAFIPRHRLPPSY
jgi:hypothetical protein